MPPRAAAAVARAATAASALRAPVAPPPRDSTVSGAQTGSWRTASRTRVHSGQAADGQGPVGPRRAEPRVHPHVRRSVLLDEDLDRRRSGRVGEGEVEDVGEGPAPRGARVEHHDETLPVADHAEPRSVAGRHVDDVQPGEQVGTDVHRVTEPVGGRVGEATAASADDPRDPGHRGDAGDRVPDGVPTAIPVAATASTASTNTTVERRALPRIRRTIVPFRPCGRQNIARSLFQVPGPSTRTGEVAVATTKEQAEAYDYEARRQATTLVSGRDEARTDPRRRINRVTAAGVLVGVLVMAGFGIAGFLGAGRGPALPESGAVLVAGSGDRYVVVDGRLHPALNLASALLVGGGSVAQVRPAALDALPRGLPVGIPEAPDALPAPERLSTAPWTVCAVPSGAATLPPEVTVRVAAPEPAAGAVDAGQAVLATGPDGTRWMVNQGRRYRLADAAAQRVGLQRATPLALPAEILDLLPEGPPIAAPNIAGRVPRWPGCRARG